MVSRFACEGRTALLYQSRSFSILEKFKSKIYPIYLTLIYNVVIKTV